VHEVVTADRFPTRVTEFAMELAELPTVVYGTTKRRLHAAASGRAGALVDAEMGPGFTPHT
jgi:hypothetical protein